MITVKYFASLREAIGREQDGVEADGALTVHDVWTRIAQHSELPSNVLIAVNMEYADWQQPVEDGDEVAFFPPVTGG